MSAIYGAIALSNDNIEQRICEQFERGYKGCVIDSFSHRTYANVSMGCGVQNFGGNDAVEVLPILDLENQILFTADCVLDHRQQIEKRLEEAVSAKKLILPKAITGQLIRQLGDGSLLYLMYLLYGTACHSYVRGVYSFVAYHIEQKKVIASVDHFAGRCLFYQVVDDVFYFSTLFFPLLDVTGKRKLNERWLLDAISLRSPAIVIEPEQTAIEGVNKIVAGHFLQVQAGAIKKECFFNPISHIKINPKITDEECKKRVRELMKQSVEGMLPKEGDVAMLLSSGLDSTTVAAIAAPILAKEGRKLHGYTSVPLKEAGLPEKGYLVYDESEKVRSFAACFDNITTTFIDCAGKNILSEAEKIVDEWELPCKSEQNAVWLREIKKAAFENGYRVMLTGATGNCTISAGSLDSYIWQYVKRGRFIKAYKDIGFFMKRYHGSRRGYLKSFVRAFLNYFAMPFQFKKNDIYRNCVTRREFEGVYHIKKRFYKEINHNFPFKNLKRMRQEIYMVNACAQIGEIETKSSLYSGILERDPMRNVEFIEFVMSLPVSCFVSREYDRRLVREFMEGIVPEEIRMDVAHRGRQSGDNEYRIESVWDRYLDQMKQVLYSDQVLHFLDQERIEEYFKVLEKGNFGDQFMEMRMLVDAYLFGMFLQKISEK